MGPSENSKLRYCRQLELQKWQIAPLLVIRAPIEGGGGTTAVLWLLDYRPPNIYPHTHADEEEELQNEEEKKEIKGKGNLGNARKKKFFCKRCSLK